jgi:hypothetical protein
LKPGGLESQPHDSSGRPNPPVGAKRKERQEGTAPPDNVSKARSFFDRALAADPSNVDAPIGSAWADALAGAFFFVSDFKAAFAAAEAKLTRALSSVPDHARGHHLLGYVEVVTKRTAEGIAECEHALEVDRNLASAHAIIGFGKVLVASRVS